MAFPTAGGVTSYSGTYIPEIWSTKLQVKFYQSTCLSRIANTDWEGEIKNQGDKVKIRTQVTIVISDYTKGQNLQVQNPEPDVIEFPIERGKYYAWGIHDLDKKQADIAFQEQWSNDTSKQMQISVERDCWADIYADASAYNKGATAGKLTAGFNLGTSGTPLVLTKDNVLDVLVAVNTVLDEQDVPPEMRWIIIPTWMKYLILLSDLKNASFSGDDSSTIRTGMVGRIGGLDVYHSNLLSRTTDGAYSVTNIIAGHKSALTYAGQLTKNEVLRNQNDFGDIHRGLNVFDWKVIKPESLVHVYARPSI